jgi:hypothetical protein
LGTHNPKVVGSNPAPATNKLLILKNQQRMNKHHSTEMLNGVFFHPQILGFSIINDGRLNEHLDTAVIKLVKYQFYKQISYQFTKHLELKNRYIKGNQHSISGELEEM